ncbi:MAG: SDR family NAD(P)-dependent oxidoreductase [Pseudomonadota bacterium]
MAGTFSGKVCVVTGAASGIGRALAQRLAGEGAMLALCDVNESGLEETHKLIGDTSNRIRIDRLDVADANAIELYAASVEQHLGKADYVFNVAGLTRLGAFEDTPLTSFEKIMDVNFWGVVRMSKAFLPQLIATKGGLVNISSVFGLIGFEGQSHYCASKFAVRGFSETIASELEGKGVSVTSVHPGGIQTDIVRLAQVDALPANVPTKTEMEANFDAKARTTADRAAEVIMNGAAKRKRRVLIGPDARVISAVQRLFPVNYRKILARVFGVEIPRASAN